MKFKKPIRPFWCYEKKAKILRATFDEDSYKKGFSMFCYGLIKPKEWKYNEVVHINNICHCYYTPFKGAVKFVINKDDIWGELISHIGVLNQVDPIGKCSKCRKEIYRELKVCRVMDDRSKVCYECIGKEKHEK